MESTQTMPLVEFTKLYTRNPRTPPKPPKPRNPRNPRSGVCPSGLSSTIQLISVEVLESDCLGLLCGFSYILRVILLYILGVFFCLQSLSNDLGWRGPFWRKLCILRAWKLNGTLVRTKRNKPGFELRTCRSHSRRRNRRRAQQFLVGTPAAHSERLRRFGLRTCTGIGCSHRSLDLAFGMNSSRQFVFCAFFGNGVVVCYLGGKDQNSKK
jgi:hypothetical protein